MGRELRNALEQATLVTDDLLLTAAHFKGVVAGAEARVEPVADRAAVALPHADPQPANIRPLPQAVAELEARPIREALAATHGNKLAASRLLGISRATLYEKLR